MKESGIFRVAEIMKTAVITHDDKMLLRAQKSDIGLKEGWKDNVDLQHENGEVIIINYVLPDGEGGIEKTISPAEYEQLPEMMKEQYRAQPLRGLQISDRVTAKFQDNRMDVTIADLFDDAESRYKKGLDNLIKLTERGVIKYTPRQHSSSRNMKEAIRHRARKYVKPTEYEHDLLFRGELGRLLMQELEQYDKGKQGEGTIYIQGFNQYQGVKKSVKYYDIGHREGTGDGEYFKLETTFHKKYFKSNGIKLNELLTQPEIQDILLIELTETITRVLNKCTKDTLEMLENALEIEPPKRKRDRARNIARATLGSERTYTERLEALEHDMADVKRRLRKVENHT